MGKANVSQQHAHEGTSNISNLDQKEGNNTIRQKGK